MFPLIEIYCVQRWIAQAKGTFLNQFINSKEFINWCSKNAELILKDEIIEKLNALTRDK